MKTTIKKLPKSKVKLSIELEKNELEKYFDQAFEELAPTVTVKGFRPGKAPRAIAEKQIGEERIKITALDKAITHSFVEALKNIIWCQ
jgi:trigger factor